MNLKNAAAVCLIALFSASLVVLIARALDLQAASRIEPQLEQIAEELRAIRKGGGALAAPADGAAEAPIDDGLVVYYFHNSTRCPTCRAIESQAHDVLQSDFASELAAGRVVWRVLNYEKPVGKQLALDFGVDKPVVVLVRKEGGRIANWRRLDRVWALWDDQPAFAQFARTEIHRMLGRGGPAPAVSLPEPAPGDIPIPDETGNLPVPQ